jgi:hypothetical protein
MVRVGPHSTKSSVRTGIVIIALLAIAKCEWPSRGLLLEHWLEDLVNNLCQVAIQNSEVPLICWPWALRAQEHNSGSYSSRLKIVCDSHCHTSKIQNPCHVFPVICSLLSTTSGCWLCLWSYQPLPAPNPLPHWPALLTPARPFPIISLGLESYLWHLSQVNSSSWCKAEPWWLPHLSEDFSGLPIHQHGSCGGAVDCLLICL